MEWIESNLVCILILVITKLDNHEAGVPFVNQLWLRTKFEDSKSFTS